MASGVLPFTPGEIGYPRLSEHWCQARDADLYALAIFRRHYSYRRTRNPETHHFTGMGNPLVLLTPDGLALFVWRQERFRRDGEQGVCCSIFRNEGPALSSELILDAERLAWNRWPGERLFTHVNPGAVRSTNPGYCFLKAGWRRLPERTKKRGLVRLEKLP